MSEPAPEAQPVQPMQPVFHTEAPPRGQWDRAATLGALLCFVAAMLALIGSFQALIIGEGVFTPRREQDLTITSWDLRIEIIGETIPEDQAPGTPLNGPALLIVVAALLAAAVLGLLVAARPGAAKFARACGLIAVAAAAFLAATVLAIGMQMRWWFDLPDIVDRLSAGPGIWTLVTATGLAAVAAVFSSRLAQPDRERVEPETPRLGIPMGTAAVVHRLPDEPAEEPKDG